MLTGAAVSSGGVLHEWLEGLLGGVDDPTSPPGLASAGLSVVPMHAGSRPPVVLPAGSGVVAGLSLATRPSELVAATYEGVALELLRSLRLLDASFASTLSVVLGGGAVAASPWWRRAFAATFDRDVRYQVNPEVGARGAAMLALGVALGATGHPAADGARRGRRHAGGRRPLRRGARPVRRLRPITPGAG